MKRKRLWVVIVSLVLLSSIAVWYFVAHATTFTVTNTGDDGSGSPSGLDTVDFDILSVGLNTIQPKSPATEVVNLLAGQHILVGSVTVSSNSTYLYVTYETVSDWQLLETRLAVVETLEGIPQNSAGNPQVGLFPYYSPEADYTIQLDHSWTPGTTLYIATHAIVYGSGPIETAWGEGTRFNEDNWAMYFTYTVQS